MSNVKGVPRAHRHCVVTACIKEFANPIDRERDLTASYTVDVDCNAIRCWRKRTQREDPALIRECPDKGLVIRLICKYFRWRG